MEEFRKFSGRSGMTSLIAMDRALLNEFHNSAGYTSSFVVGHRIFFVNQDDGKAQQYLDCGTRHA